MAISRFNFDSPLMRFMVWFGTTILSIGIVYGTVSTRISQLEKAQEGIEHKLDRIDQKTDGLPLIQQLLLDHMKKDVR